MSAGWPTIQARAELSLARLGLTRRVLLIVVIGLVLAGVVSSYASARGLWPMSAADLYARNCANCHGPRGGRIPAAPLDSPSYVSRLGPSSLYRTIAEGKGTMLALGKARGGPLGDDEIKTLVGFLLAPERAGPGREVYQSRCAECHGEQGNRIPAAVLNSRQALDQRSNQQLSEAIARGKGAMAGLGREVGGPLDDQQVTAVVEYLRTLSGSIDPGQPSAGVGGPGAAAKPAAAAPAAAPAAAAAKPGASGAQDLFKQNCAACHPSITLSRTEPAQVRAAIADGVSGKGMPAFGGRLSAEELDGLTELLVSGKAGGAAAGGGGSGGAVGAGAGGTPFSGIVRHVDGWFTKHPLVVKENGTQLCTRCHQPTFCAGCHSGGRIKPQ